MSKTQKGNKSIQPIHIKKEITFNENLNRKERIIFIQCIDSTNERKTDKLQRRQNKAANKFRLQIFS